MGNIAVVSIKSLSILQPFEFTGLKAVLLALRLDQFLVFQKVLLKRFNYFLICTWLQILRLINFVRNVGYSTFFESRI